MVSIAPVFSNGRDFNSYNKETVVELIYHKVYYDAFTAARLEKLYYTYYHNCAVDNRRKWNFHIIIYYDASSAANLEKL